MTHSSDACPDCGVGPGEFHKAGCDIEQCPYCGQQLISCRCRRTPPLDDHIPWSGVWPGVAECHEFGWFAARAGQGSAPVRV